MRWLDSITDSMDMNVSKPREAVKDRGAWRAAVHSHKQSDMTEAIEHACTHTCVYICIF